MNKQTQINRIHETMNDIFSDLHDINVTDEQSREAKQNAILSLISMRKTMDHLGMHHRKV